MNYKKKIICLLVLFTIVVVNVLNVVVKSDDAETLTLSGIEAVAATYENSPGNYTGAHNQYCTSPKNATGCVSDPDPTRTCSYSIFYIKIIVTCSNVTGRGVFLFRFILIIC